MDIVRLGGKLHHRREVGLAPLNKLLDPAPLVNVHSSVSTGQRLHESPKPTRALSSGKRVSVLPKLYHFPQPQPRFPESCVLGTTN